MEEHKLSLIADMVESLEDDLREALDMINEIHDNYPNIHRLYGEWEEDAKKLLARYGLQKKTDES